MRLRLRLLGDRARELHDERKRVQSLLVDGACSRAAGLNRRKNIGEMQNLVRLKRIALDKYANLKIESRRRTP